MTQGYPSGALGCAVGVLVYACVSLLCCILVMWLVTVHHDKTSYVGLLAFAVFFGTLASIIQQCHSLVDWTGIRYGQHEFALTHIGHPQLIVSGMAYGLDLVLFYIQTYSYNVCAFLALSWAATLLQSIIGFADLDKYRVSIRHTSTATKIFAFVFPPIIMSLLAIEQIQKSTVAFLVVYDTCMFAALSLTIILLVVIFCQYICIRRKILSWNPYARAENSAGESSIYDRWLMIRFTIAVFVLSAYQTVVVVFQTSSARKSSSVEAIGQVDLSVSAAISDSLVYIPGVSSGWLVFVVFGTTKIFRQTMYRTFVPKRWQKEDEPASRGYGNKSNATTMYSSRTGKGMSTKDLMSDEVRSGQDVEDIELSDVVLDQDIHHHYQSREERPQIHADADPPPNWPFVQDVPKALTSSS